MYMRVKTITCYTSAKVFDDKINDFLVYLERNNFDLINIDYQYHFCTFTALISYQDKN